MTNFPEYPFAALVGQETLKRALLLCAVDPVIGGVLVCGEKGTAKSTAARGLASLLPTVRRVAGCPFQCDGDSTWECPHCRSLAERNLEDSPVSFVDLPLGATEDRVLGTLDFESALREGRRSIQPGLLARAHRGILYIDEVNLLPDHLVDVLLDVSAMGVNVVQREGVEIRHPSRFILIGTMNPEEGDLRPQFLDRFGMMVTVAAPREPGPRTEIVRRRLAFESDPARFNEHWLGEQENLRAQVVQARRNLAGVEHDDSLLTLISEICCELHVDGMRADIVLLRTARTLAAWEGHAQVTREDVRAAAELVLPHRRKRRPNEKPGLDPQQLDELLSRSPACRFASADSNDPPPSPPSAAPEEDRQQVFVAPQPASVRPIELAEITKGSLNQGRRNPASVPGRGAFVRAIADPAPTDLAMGATIRSAVRHGPGPSGGVQVRPEDLHRKERVGRTGTLLLFVVDGSGSMAARRRMEAVKGAVLGLLQSAYEERDHLAVIGFRGPEAELLLPATRSVEAAEQALQSLPTGGRTPLAHALTLAREFIERSRRVTPGLPIMLVLLTDGKANVCLPGCVGDPWQQALGAAHNLMGTPALVFDTEIGMVRSGRARLLADALDAECLTLEDLSADTLLIKLSSHHAPRDVSPQANT